MKNELVTITHQRDKCIGCNYCVEYAPARWAMSKQDGKSILLEAVPKKGFWTARVPAGEKDANMRAAKACPVNIIRVS